jgi:phosphinothricin acetyltransferase
MSPDDWASVARIYAAGIEGGNATFEHTVPSWEEWYGARIKEPCLVARSAGAKIIGWAALSRVSSRECYSGVGSVSIYVDPQFAGRGVGRMLLRELIEGSERAGFWTLEAGIFPENAASIALHEHSGFRLVGTQSRVGCMLDGRWRDVLLYERRSQRVGTH